MKPGARLRRWAVLPAVAAWPACSGDGPGAPSEFVPPGAEMRIAGIRFDATSLRKYAGPGPGRQGTDLWPVAEGADGRLYAAGGDGRGFDGPDVRGLVVARLVGGPEALSGSDLFRKPDVLPTGIISVNGDLYMIEQERGNGFFRIRFGRSADLGMTWSYNGNGTDDWDLADPSRAFGHSSFVPHGRDNADAFDEHVYVISHGPNATDLLGSNVEMLRAPRGSIQDVSTHEYFTGLDAQGEPTWDGRVGARRPVITRPGEVHWAPRISHHPGLDRYLLTIFTDSQGTLAVYEGPKPWGPWTLIHENVLLDGVEKFGLSFVSAEGWLSPDGRSWWAIFSGDGSYDALNVIRADLTLEPVG